jgi:protein ImuB
MVRHRPDLKDIPFVMAAPERGRMVIKAANMAAQEKGIDVNMVVADCRAILPTLQVFDDKPEQSKSTLSALAAWCLRYTPTVAIDGPDGLILDISGCPHLWGGEKPYLKDILSRLRGFGYDIRAAIADTIGTAWAVSRYGMVSPIIEPCCQLEALLPLPPVALRLDHSVVVRLEKFGLYQIQSFMNMPQKALRRRFGDDLLKRLAQALGQEAEFMEPIRPAEPHQERLPSLEPIRTATGIAIALKKLLADLCQRLAREEKGLRKAVFTCYRVDGGIQKIEIGTNSPSRNAAHLFSLFELKIETIEPALGIEVFTIDATIVEDAVGKQDVLWNFTEGGNGTAIGELLDRIAGKLGLAAINRYLPDEHYWPERSVKAATSFTEEPQTQWRTDLPRPIHLLSTPETIEVTVPIPDHPPMLFRHKGVLHNVKKADSPERIEQEWWIEQGQYRDYFIVEDEHGARYWIFRQGSYEHGNDPKWFIHGFFA